MTPLNEQALHQAAMASTGLSDFGAPDYLDGLRIGLDAVRQRPPSRKLDQLFAARALSALVGRLHTEHSWRLHPVYKSRQIVAPIIITGMSRSGTSALHQLLATDPQFQWVPHWIAQAPTVRLPREQWRDNPVYQAQAEAVAREYHSRPELRAAHNVEAGLPEECINMMCQSFVSMSFITTLPLPHYRKWFDAQDETGSYRRYADVLRLVGAATPESTPWLLKNPSHGVGIEALLKVFPDARIVVTHRDPVAAVGSGISLSNLVSGDLADPGYFSELRSEVGLRNVSRLMAAAERRPRQFHHVHYRRFVADPMGVVADLYRQFGLTLSAAAEAAMRQWIAGNPQGKFGKHRYTADELGLDEAALRRRFAAYIERYSLAGAA